MLKRLFHLIAVSIGLSGAAIAQEHSTLDNASIVVPAGWREVKKEEDRLTFRSSDDRQQATISLMQFGVSPSFEDFKRLCQLRVEAEKKAAPNAFIDPDAPVPFEKSGGFGMFYSGGEKQTGRIFSCYLSLANKGLFTIYLEGVGVVPKDHLKSFEAFVSGLKRK